MVDRSSQDGNRQKPHPDHPNPHPRACRRSRPRPKTKQSEPQHLKQHEKQRRGCLGEQAAAAFLESRGYRIVATNVRQGRWEIDLIATHERNLVFVEVRSRAHVGFGFPSETVDLRKQRHVANAAHLWLRGQRPFWDAIRFDVIEVTGDGSGLSCRHFANAFESPF